MEYKIRKRTKEDCPGVAHVVTVAWNETYKGIVPDDFLNSLYENEEARTQNSYNKFDESNNKTLVLEVDGEVVGFSSYGKANNDEDCGEIRALYIINKYHGYGFGKKLVDASIEEIKKLGYTKMIITCLKGNPSNEFYKHIGGVYIRDGIYERLNLPENVYYFEKI